LSYGRSCERSPAKVRTKDADKGEDGGDDGGDDGGGDGGGDIGADRVSTKEGSAKWAFKCPVLPRLLANGPRLRHSNGT